MSELVQRLAKGNHPVEVSCRPERTVKAFKECIDRGYVHIKFTKTQGGTELGIKVTDDDVDSTGADFEAEKGRVKVQGKLTLDYVPVRLVAEVDLGTLSGKGHLVILQ